MTSQKHYYSMHSTKRELYNASAKAVEKQMILILEDIVGMFLLNKNLKNISPGELSYLISILQ